MDGLKIFAVILVSYFASIGIYFTLLRIWLTIDANKRIRQLKRGRREQLKWKE
ncbi:MAG: hypothetical protein IJX99_02035 [Clostridia bacterium]|nr:hypothetical protein [Clostridia bacterium]